MFESRISVGATVKLPGWDKPRANTSAWSCDMEGHARKCVERYCELATRQSNCTRFPVFLWTITKFKGNTWETKVNCQKFATILHLNACTWHELVDLTFCGQATNWHDLSQDGLKHVTDDWHD